MVSYFKDACVFLDLHDLTQKTTEHRKVNIPGYIQHKYQVDLPVKLETFLFWSCLLHLNAVIYHLVISPIRAIVSLGICLSKRGKVRMTARCEYDLVRLLVTVVCTTFLCLITNSSQIYHWIRSQGNFKLYLLKAVFSVSDTLLRTLG